MLAEGEPHCTERPCPGATLPSGSGLEICEAVHAEICALIRCPDPRRVHTCYATTAPCLHCVKILMNTGCRRVVYAEDYPHVTAARLLWERAGREWVRLSPPERED